MCRRNVSQAELVAFVGNFWDLSWVLDDQQQRLLVGLPPGQFDDDRGAWGGVLAQTYKYRGDETRSQAYADSGRIGYEAQLRDAPDDAQLHMLHGLMLAYLGRKAEAIQEGERGLALQPITEDAYSGAYNTHLLARIYILTGEQEKAIDQLESLLRSPTISPPAGSGSIRPSTPCGRTPGSSAWSGDGSGARAAVDAGLVGPSLRSG